MRLHSLEVSAFGPFGDTATVDFDALGADGLFLLHGQTGAGKTTILDAVAFALYGTVPGARQQGKRLLSDHAGAGSVPKVVLEATIGGRRLRLTRSPEYERAKLRGTGTTKENAKATLTWLDGQGQNLTRLDEIGEEIGRLLGMSADQFFQVVLLPQGEFARFLRADTDERGDLLERLFDTTRFGTVEDWFAERRRESAATMESGRKSVDLMLARVSTAAGIEAGADADPLTWAHKLRADAEEARDTATAELVAARAAAARATATLTEATRIRGLQQRAARAEAELRTHAEAADERAAQTEELARAVRAAPIAELRVEATSAAETAARESKLMGTLAEGVGAIDEGRALLARLSWPEAAEDRGVIAATIRGWTDEVARLDDLIAESLVADALQETVDRHGERRRELASAAEELELRRTALPEQLRAAEDDLAAARQAVAALPALDEARGRAADTQGAAVALAQQRLLRADAAGRLSAARGRHQDARGELLDLRERRLAGMAAELAAGLADGEPCVVCGSAQHPNPAEPSEAVVTRADEDAARVAEQRLAQEVDAASERLAKVDQAIEVLLERGGDRDPDQLAAELSAATEAHADAHALAAREPALADRLSGLRAEQEGLQERSRVATAELATLDERIAGAVHQLETIRTRIAEASGVDESPQARRDRLDALAAAVSRLRDLRAQVTAAQETAEALSAKVVRSATEAGFDSVDEAVAATRDERRVAAVEAALAQARDQRVRAESVLAEAEVAAVAGMDAVDPSVAEAEVERANAVVNSAIAVASEADRRLADLERLVAQLAKEVGALAPMQQRHAELAGLAEVIAGRGQNARKMSLRSYVLAARLEEVAIAASTRLRRMSGGRYEFVHADGAGPRGKRGGLGLDIRDDYTGVVRSAKTLSGGESFLASLSLALGLADVVAAESGGLVLDTMFIDEGFGTLDAETLESVMGVLDELRAGGRVVGIVSHVDEMRQRIPSRLHVIRGRAGSSVEVVAG
ncbi:AAA family ATPase [Rhodococcus sp. UNC363MFTsu5.1]|uniref:AAA family ATPase n=1 Tax=Rhodococcus sp. UNC363MFTsu5.1 TaxID=1449069 RepID=UPI00047F02C8|nr:SMC family ATPase [Rhodococcus sp. UNC363MFTsu5.1]